VDDRSSDPPIRCSSSSIAGHHQLDRRPSPARDPHVQLASPLVNDRAFTVLLLPLIQE
jgi:hypothetical protein